MTLFLTLLCFCERKNKVHYLSVPKQFHHRNVQQLTKKAVLHFNNGPLAWILDVFFVSSCLTTWETCMIFLLKSCEENLSEIDKI